MRQPITTQEQFDWFRRVAHYETVTDSNRTDVRNFHNCHMISPHDLQLCAVGCHTQQILALNAIRSYFNEHANEIQTRLNAVAPAEVKAEAKAEVPKEEKPKKQKKAKAEAAPEVEAEKVPEAPEADGQEGKTEEAA